MEPTLSPRALNRALLARQLLLERSALPLTRALERVGGLQTQYAPSGYIGLWSRLRDFNRASLTRALEQRRVVQGTLMRSTIHMVSAGDYWRFVAGIKKGRQAWWRGITRKEFGDIDMEGAAAAFREALARGPRKVSELKKLLEVHRIPAVVWSGIGLWVDLVRVPPSGTWEQRRADLYGLAAEWLPAPEVSEEAGIEHLVRRYLGAFGPAPVKDIAAWAGIPVAMLAPVVERLRLRQFRDERGGRLLDLPGAPLPDATTPAPVRFLPTWEAALLVHARRTGILPEAYRPRVFSIKTPHSIGTFLVDGAVAGTWKVEAGTVSVEPFEPLPRAVRRAVDEEARGLSAFHQG